MLPANLSSWFFNTLQCTTKTMDIQLHCWKVHGVLLLCLRRRQRWLQCLCYWTRVHKNLCSTRYSVINFIQAEATLLIVGLCPNTIWTPWHCRSIAATIRPWHIMLYFFYLLCYSSILKQFTYYAYFELIWSSLCFYPTDYAQV